MVESTAWMVLIMEIQHAGSFRDVAGIEVNAETVIVSTGKFMKKTEVSATARILTLVEIRKIMNER